MRRIATVLLLVWVISGLAVARGTAEEQAAVLPQDGIETLNASLERIAEALEALRVEQRVLVALRRLELAERRIAPLESRLEGARGEVRSRQEEISQLEAVLQQFQDTVQEAIRSGVDPVTIPERVELERVRSTTDLARERLADAEMRVIEVENEIASSRRRIAVLDEMTEELLDQMDNPPGP